MSDRRSFLTVITGGLAAVATVPTSTAVAGQAEPFPVRDTNVHLRLEPHPDGPLLQACEAFNKLEAEFVMTFDGSDTDEETPKGMALALDRRRIEAEQDPFVDMICDTPATTLAGLRAKAGSLALYDEFAINVDATEHTDRLRTSLLQDILGSEMPKIEPVRSDRDRQMEADFLVACRERPGAVLAALRQLYVGEELPASVLGVIPSLERRQSEIDRGA